MIPVAVDLERPEDTWNSIVLCERFYRKARGFWYNRRFRAMRSSTGQLASFSAAYPYAAPRAVPPGDFSRRSVVNEPASGRSAERRAVRRVSSGVISRSPR